MEGGIKNEENDFFFFFYFFHSSKENEMNKLRMDRIEWRGRACEARGERGKTENKSKNNTFCNNNNN